MSLEVNRIAGCGLVIGRSIGKRLVYPLTADAPKLCFPYLHQSPLPLTCHSPCERRRSAFVFEEAPKLLGARRMPQLAQRLGFDLADTFACDVVLLADLFERMVGGHFDAEAHA